MDEPKKSQASWRKILFIAVLGVFVLVLLTVLVLLQSSQLWKLFAVDTASDTLTLYALTSLNFFAFVIFAFIFLRNVIKLARERRRLQIGSRLKTRLFIYFIAVSLLPIGAMAMFSYLFLNRALEKWFSRLPETVIEEARDVQKRAIAERVEKFNEKAALLAGFAETNANFDETVWRQMLERGDLAAIELLAPNGDVLARILRENSVAEQKQALRDALINADQPDVKELQDGIGFDAQSLALSDGRRLRVVSRWHGEENISFPISNSPQEFERLKQEQAAVRQLGFSTLSLLTFLLIFAASWIAFHLGRSLTQPIRALAEASGEIARGNLHYRVEALAEDELAMLVSAFNQMAAGLQENQQKLEERRHYIETVLQSLSTGVISLDENNRVTTINSAAIEMLRLKGAKENLNLAEIVTGEDFSVMEKLLARARRLGQASEQTVLFRQSENGSREKSGETAGLPVALTATALRGNYGKNQGAVLVIEDLSELLTAQRAAAWQEVARRMAHEIKNPLTPIQLAAERIQRNFHRFSSFVLSPLPLADSDLNKGQRTKDKGQLTKVIDESTETILREVDGLKSMVNEFSHFARLPDAKLENGDLNEIIRQTLALYEDRLGGVRIETELEENLPAAMLDAEQMRRTFVNLIDNALEAFDENGTEKKITVKTSFDKTRGVLIAEVADNGRGIAPAAFSKLFQPYFSTKGRGTGLGLAIVQRIVTEHGGKIRAVSSLSKGARFVIELPIAST